MKRNALILLCDNYPLSAGEFFIDDELRVIAPKFDKVLVYTASADSGKNLNRFVPNNAEVVSFSRQKFETCKLKSIFRIFSPIFITEFFFALRKLPIKYWFAAFKIMYVELHRAKNLKNDLLGLCEERKLNPPDCIFYSYWHDYKALALALLRKTNPNLKCVARAHRWDVFADKNRVPYLPFKKYVIDNLSNTISISKAGKEYFYEYVKPNSRSRISISYLGKINARVHLFEKHDSTTLICTCSTLTPVKRVDKIIEVLSKLKLNNLCWIHFGDGPLREELLSKAKEMLQNVDYEFKGIVPNEEILDFYAENYVDLFINLSSSEGIPVSIMEALSAGIPVLATDVGGTSEAVNKGNGFLVPEDFNADEVAGQIESYINLSTEKKKEYRRGAYEFWKENYEAEKNYSEFLGILENL